MPVIFSTFDQFYVFKVLLLLFVLCGICCSQRDCEIPRRDGEISFNYKDIDNDCNRILFSKTVLSENSVHTVLISNVPWHTPVIIVQVHAYLYNVFLSYTFDLEPKNFVNGSNIGLVHRLTSARNASVFLRNPEAFSVSALIVIYPLTNKEPIPGGCNIELETFDAPYLVLNNTGPMIIVSGQPAMSPGDVNSNKCSFSDLKYRLYHLYLTERDFREENYFQGILSMLTPEKAHNNSQLVKDSMTGPPLSHVFGAYRGTGSVFTLVVESEDGSVAAYVPAHSFACGDFPTVNSCQILSNTSSKVICAAMMFFGLFLCLTGHIYFAVELIIMGSITGGLISYILLNIKMQTASDYTVEATAIGVCLGLIWLIIWWFINSPILSLTIPLLNLGFMIGCLVFFGGLSDVSVFESNINYWLTLISIALMIHFFLILTPKFSNIMSCSVIGGYASILPVDYYAGTNLKYILLNVIYRATIEGFELAKTYPPFQTPDIILTVVWIMLAFFGILWQMWMSHGKPPFPPPSRPCSSSVSSTSDLTTPLLAEARYSYYSPDSDNVFHA